MSPIRGRNSGNDFTTDTGDHSTQDVTRQHAYKSATKMRMTKKSIEPAPHQMSATIHTTRDIGEAFPNVKGAAERSKRTIN